MLPKRLLRRYAFRFLAFGMLFWLGIAMYSSVGPGTSKVSKHSAERLDYRDRDVVNNVDMNPNLVIQNNIERDSNILEHVRTERLPKNEQIQDEIKARAVNQNNRNDFVPNRDSDKRRRHENEEFKPDSHNDHADAVNEMGVEQDQKAGDNGNEVDNAEENRKENVEKKEEEIAQLAPPDDDKLPNANGPGEMGKPVVIDTKQLTKEQKADYDKGWQMNAFNRYASDMISLHRSLPDVRDPHCKNIKYDKDLPDACVIVIFHNEALSVLLRTVHSVIDRSEPHLLKEVILVDDASNFDHLKDPLQDFVDNTDKVSLIRSAERTGLIRARLLGFDRCTAKVAIFLDSHCEATEGWMGALLNHISKNETNVVQPFIDKVNPETFEFVTRSTETQSYGGFDWDLTYKWYYRYWKRFARRHRPYRLG